MLERDIFIAALQKAGHAERQAYLNDACADQPKLREQVDALLRLYENAGSFLEAPAGALQSPDALKPTELAPIPDTLEQLGTMIGPYKLLQLIGEGGMGTVYMAEQTEPVKRKVALKLIKAGMDSKQVIARFEAERQALAMMDHVNIARVFDGGTTPLRIADFGLQIEATGDRAPGSSNSQFAICNPQLGRPYFVMELVDGVPITKYCDDNHLTPRERLELFVPVCNAIQHAHQKGIIHRDIKPSNVLVAIYDGKPVPKVIDFGVAKATEQKLTERTLFTQYGTMVGTLEYMSPEQAEMSPDNAGIDTRSDIYSLGVLLYELLAGSPPFTRKDLEKAGMLEMLRVIREEEPSKPSTKLSSSDALPTLSVKRGTEPAKLTKLVRGDLDWIVMKCLEKDRNRRYETANGFAADVQRYLADEVVEARPPNAGYRLRKFVRRNRGPVLAGSAIILLLVAGIVGTAIGLVRAEERAEGERRAKVTAEKRLDQIEKGIDLLGALFNGLDPFAEEKEGRPLRAILRDRLDQTAAALDGETIGDPLIVARLQDRLGQTYLGLGSAARADGLFAKSLATREAELGADHPLTLASHHNRAVALEAAGKRVAAMRRFEQVLDGRTRLLGPDHPDTLATLHGLAVVYRQAGKSNDAVRLLEQVRDARVKRLGPDDDQTRTAILDLAEAYRGADRHAEAIALAEQVRDAWVRKYGDVHPIAINAIARLANIYQAGYKMSAALDLYKRTEAVALQKFGPYHPLTLKIQAGLAHMLRAYRKTKEAIPLLESVRERRVMVLGSHHPSTLHTLDALGKAHEAIGERDKALLLYQQVAAGLEELEYVHYDAERFLDNLATCLEHSKEYAPAEVWRRKLLVVAREKHGPESFYYASSFGLAGLGVNLIQQRKYADAEPVLRESVTTLLKIKADGWEGLRAQSLLGDALLGQQLYADAEPHLVQSYQGMVKRVQAPGHHAHGQLDQQNLSEAAERLVRLYDATNRPDEAAKWRKELDALTPTAKQPVKSKGN